ncbi:MAG: DUF4837 family protein [Gemmatimonadota bacterium]|nr:DUF4837 family protein [Gemmatimonadota bacterium]
MPSINRLRPLVRIAALILPVLFSGCEEVRLQKPRAFGREKEILVICNNAVWQAVEEELRRKIEVPIQAVRWEPIFEVAQTDAEHAKHYIEWNKIILIESLENMQLLPEVVKKETLGKIGAGQGLFFTNFDIWAKGQRVAGLAASRDDFLPALVKLHGDRIFKDFLHQLEEEERVRMFLSGANDNLADSLAASCGFSIVLPKVYARIRLDTLAENRLLFVHQDPTRSLFITWEDNPVTEIDRSREALAAMRDHAISDIYPHQHTHPARVDTQSVTAGGLTRLRVYGTWEDLEEISGGVYISQIIETPGGGRRYFLDFFLFCPNARLNKYRYIFQLDRILNSFKLQGT